MSGGADIKIRQKAVGQRAESLTKKTSVAEEQWRSVSARKTVKKAGWERREYESEGVVSEREKIRSLVQNRPYKTVTFN